MSYMYLCFFKFLAAWKCHAMVQTSSLMLVTWELRWSRGMSNREERTEGGGVKKKTSIVQLLSHVWLFTTAWTAASQVSLPSPSPGVCANSWPLSWWCHPTTSSSIIPFSSCLQSFPASGSFQMGWPFMSGGQSIGASASASVLPINILDWFPLGLTGLMCLQSKGLSGVFSNTTVQKH